MRGFQFFVSSKAHDRMCVCEQVNNYSAISRYVGVFLADHIACVCFFNEKIGEKTKKKTKT